MREWLRLFVHPPLPLSRVRENGRVGVFVEV